MANFVVLCDYPAFDDPEKDLKDNMGRYTWHLLKSANAPCRDLAIEFLYDTARDMKYGRSNWRDIEARHKPRVIVAMGQKVFKDLELEGYVTKVRGSVFEIERRSGPMYVIPTFSPREMKKPFKMYAEEPMEKGIYALHDFQRAVTVYRNGWNVPEERFELNPTIEQVEGFVENAIDNQWLLGSDLEGDGLNIEWTNIVVMGFAWNESDAIVIPMLTTDKADYWNPSEKERVIKAINRLFKHGRFMFQNGVGYDVPLLRARGWDFPVENFELDTMVEHHAINPESPHNIGFINSIYGKQKHWKEVFKLYLGADIFIHPDIPGQTRDSTQQGMRLYNARDCVALHQIHNGMQDYIKQLEEHDDVFKNTNKIITKSMEEARACLVMEESGLLLDKVKLREWVKYLLKSIDEVETKIRTKHDLTDAFSLTSPDHKRMWIYDEKIEKLDRVKLKKEMEKYDYDVFNYQYECSHCGRKKVQKFQPELEEVPQSLSKVCSGKGGCGKERRHARTDKAPSLLKRKDKDTNVFRELLGNYELAKCIPLPQLRGYKPLLTNKDKSALNKDALVRYQIHIGRRLDDISNLRRRQAKHDEEERDLKSLSETLELIKTYVKYKKLQDSFCTFAPRRDGRIYPHFMVTGTSTGRLSCKNPNAQQIPSGKMGELIRGCFKAGPGRELMSVDWENLEVWIGAYFMEDKALQEILEAGTNFHDFNTEVFFKIKKPVEGDSKEHIARWNQLRKAAKVIVFARILYGGSDRGIYTKVMTANPDCGLTFNDFKEAIANYMRLHPDYAKWCKEVQALALEKRISINAFGRVRVLMGADNAIMRQALNSPVQGSAAEVARECMPKILTYIKEKGWDQGADYRRVKLVLQVHDEFVVECPTEMRKEVAQMMHDIMTAPIKINAHVFSLKIDIEVGKYWGGMNGYDLEKDEVASGSKH